MFIVFLNDGACNNMSILELVLQVANLLGQVPPKKIKAINNFNFWLVTSLIPL